MLTTLTATITAIVRADTQRVEARAVALGEISERRIIAFPPLTGAIAVGDTVLLNVTATNLSLGTGGVDFVLANFSPGETGQTLGEPDGTEHIIKLRYTPFQHAVRAVEMTHEYAAHEAEGLRGVPVVVCELHSQVAAVCAGVKAHRPDARVVYVYTDTAALPLAFSRLVPQLKKAGLLDVTITAGQAFGGDHEAVSVASALIAARHVAKADVIVVGQGPGNAGTGTVYGWGGIEQGSWLDTARFLGGTSIFVLRVSDADERARHQGVSHHSNTVCEMLAPSVLFAVPSDSPEIELPSGSTASLGASAPGLALLAEHGIAVTTMGRTVEQDRAFFAFAAAAGAVAAALMPERQARLSSGD